jgi:hypothetical protein
MDHMAIKIDSQEGCRTALRKKSDNEDSSRRGQCEGPFDVHAPQKGWTNRSNYSNRRSISKVAPSGAIGDVQGPRRPFENPRLRRWIFAADATKTRLRLQKAIALSLSSQRLANWFGASRYSGRSGGSSCSGTPWNRRNARFDEGKAAPMENVLHRLSQQ